uniref:F-actin-capping protein subunit alpha n=1 Tax=Acrobeloides nanus TaxID=290746 RepID=A0A914EIH6_9BILA
MTSDELPATEKVRIASDFLLQSPPGEFNEVFNDVRMLVNNDAILEQGCAPAVAQYNKEQYIPVKIDGTETLITQYNELPDGRFFDPKTKKVFRYDHLRKEASDFQPAHGEIEEKLEPWRKALQAEADHYIDEHFHNTGVATVFAQKGSIILCVESHQFQPKNYWNGRWRSTWKLPNHEGKSSSQEINGVVRLQVHYYEDGNVQLISNKEFSAKVQLHADREKSAKEILRIISEAESAYQNAVQENYIAMSDTTFKALRRQLPITRSKLDWLKLQTYRIAQDMKPQ